LWIRHRWYCCLTLLFLGGASSTHLDAQTLQLAAGLPVYESHCDAVDCQADWMPDFCCLSAANIQKLGMLLRVEIDWRPSSPLNAEQEIHLD